MSNEMTAEEYKAKVLKQNFAQRVISYEDMIAELQTQLALLQQQQQQQAQSAEKRPDERGADPADADSLI
jgi:predicted Rossmann fold nucleotide-binding protein DprA/Smf involved in DNA uptake